MSVVLLLAVIVVLVAVFFVATGRGGELASEHVDYPPLDLGPVTAADVAMLRPPTALWGYNMQVTDEALDRIARAMRDRDITIASLQRQLADLEPVAHRTARPGAAPPGGGPGAAGAPQVTWPGSAPPPASAGPGSVPPPASVGPGSGPPAASGRAAATPDPPPPADGTAPDALAAGEQDP